MFRKVILFFLVINIILSNLVIVKAQESVKVFLNGEKIQFDVEPTIINDRVMVPFRKVFEELGASYINWDEESQTIEAAACYNYIQLEIDNKTAKLYGLDVELDVPPMIINDRTLVPLRFIMQSVGANVEWNDETQTVNINISTVSGIEQKNLKYYEKYPEVISLESTGCNTYETLEEENSNHLYQYNLEVETVTSADILKNAKLLRNYELLLLENGYRNLDAPTTTKWFTNDKYYVGIFYFTIFYPSIIVTSDGKSLGLLNN